MGRVMRLLNFKPLNDLVDQEPDCAPSLAAWRDTVLEGTWSSFSEMAQDLAFAPVQEGESVLFTVVPKICLVEATVIFRRQVLMVTEAHLLRALGRHAA